MMHELDKEYLGFKWNNKYYVFKVLPFGISTAGYIFSKLMREIVKFWRTKGYKIVLYLDDGIGGASTFQEAKVVSSEIQGDLDKLGFLLAEDKSHWDPVQELVWLGLVWNTKINKTRLLLL